MLGCCAGTDEDSCDVPSWGLGLGDFGWAVDGRVLRERESSGLKLRTWRNWSVGRNKQDCSVAIFSGALLLCYVSRCTPAEAKCQWHESTWNCNDLFGNSRERYLWGSLVWPAKCTLDWATEASVKADRTCNSAERQLMMMYYRCCSLVAASRTGAPREYSARVTPFTFTAGLAQTRKTGTASSPSVNASLVPCHSPPGP